MVIALILGRAERARVAGALRGLAGVQFCELASEMSELVAAGFVRLVVAELHDRSGTPIGPVLRAIRTQFPTIPVLPYVAPTASDMRALLAIATTVGVSGVMIRGEDDAGVALRSMLRSSLVAMPAGEVLDAIRQVVPPQLWPFFAFCVEEASGPITVGGAADILGIPRRTLVAAIRCSA